jgi:betaine-aldehyde dehydrogenase
MRTMIDTMLPKQPYEYAMWIDGDWVTSKSSFTRESPAHDVTVGRYPMGSEADTDAAVAAARRAFDAGPWPKMSGADRSKALLRVADGIRAKKEELALIEVLESGKPISQARDEMEWSAGLWDYAAALCRHIYGDTYNTLGESMMGFMIREPIGVVAMITPWNFPFLIISQKLPFALAAGCTCVVKPSELTPGTTLRLGQLIEAAGIPKGVVNIVSGYGNPVGARLASHSDVDMISFTGSTAVGRSVVEASRSNLKKVELELGGKNPQIVFADSDLDAALDAVVFGVYFNMGECCNSGSRLMVQKSIAQEFAAKVIEKAKEVVVGDPLDEATKVGAIVNQTQLDKIQGYIQTGQREGATLKLGGNQRQTERGRFFEPTVFEGVNPGMTIAKEEIFGPVLSVIPFETPDEALRIANSTAYGLSAGVWTKNIDVAFQLGRGIRAGTVWINTFMEGYPELSFGGYKESGLGRELGRFAIEEFTELKTIQVHLGPRTKWLP